jgi:ABC-type sugar transport system permease subunit
VIARESTPRRDRRESGLAWILMLPALAIVVCVAAFPVLWTFWESLHRHDLRMPWLGMPFVGLANYLDAAADGRAWSAVGRTLLFTAAAVAIELGLGLALALALNRAARGRGLLRTAALLPWAVPTVVAALVWRFIFESPGGLADALLRESGLLSASPVWLADPVLAWVPIVLADAWKTTPFVALLLLAGLQHIDPAVHEAAAMDGAGAFRRFRSVTLPLLAPAIGVTVVLRALDAFRIFDVIYVLTGGGPGTATEPISLYAFSVLFRDLRVGYGSALSMIVFAGSFVLALIWIRIAGQAREAGG